MNKFVTVLLLILAALCLVLSQVAKKGKDLQAQLEKQERELNYLRTSVEEYEGQGKKVRDEHQQVIAEFRELKQDHEDHLVQLRAYKNQNGELEELLATHKARLKAAEMKQEAAEKALAKSMDREIELKKQLEVALEQLRVARAGAGQ